MKFFGTVLIYILLLHNISFAQQTLYSDSLVNKISDSLISVATKNYSMKIKDSMVRKVKDSIRLKNLLATASYPLIRNSQWSGVLPVAHVEFKIDPAIRYKLVFSMQVWSRDSAGQRKINEGLAEIGRIINLHIGAGVAKEDLELAIVIHGSPMNVYLKNDEYHKKFKTDNPNLDLLKQFTNIKTELIACGQAESYFNIPAALMIPEVKTAFSARVALSTYQLKGYVLIDITDE